MEYLAGALGRAIKESGVRRQALEQKMGLSKGYLSRILGGRIELRAEQIFDILEALEIDPGTFFRAAYPPAPGETEDPRIQGVLQYAENTGGARQALTDADMDRRVREALARILLGDGR